MPQKIALILGVGAKTASEVPYAIKQQVRDIMWWQLDERKTS